MISFREYQIIMAVKDNPGIIQRDLIKYLNNNMIGYWSQSSVSGVLSKLVRVRRIIKIEKYYWYY